MQPEEIDKPSCDFMCFRAFVLFRKASFSHEFLCHDIYFR